MRYEEYHVVGEVSQTKEYEGAPEEIAQLISLTEKAESAPSLKIKDSDIKNLSYQDQQDLLKYACLAFRYFGVSLSDLLRMDKDTIEWLYIFVDKTVRREEVAQEKQKKAVINLQPQITINSAEDLANIHNVVRQELDKQWKLLTKTYEIQTTR